MVFYESDLTFNFSQKDWEIIQYDTHRYYKILSGAGLKGVDFLGIYKKKKVVFFEIKHFHSNLPNKTTSHSIIKDTSKFKDRITGKMTDSLKAINVIHQYLERKSWYRFYLKWQHLIPSFILKNKDWYFWHRLSQLIHRRELLTFVLWLEMDNAITKERLHFLLKPELENKLLSIVGEVKITDRTNPIFKASLTWSNIKAVWRFISLEYF